MPNNEALYYNVINGTARHFRPLPVRRDKKKSHLRGFLLTVLILLTCIASLGICAQLYWDSYLRVQRLSADVQQLQRLSVDFHDKLQLIRQQYDEQISSLQREIKRLATDDCEIEAEPESEEDELVSPAEDRFGGSNDPLYEQSPESVENTTGRDRKWAERRKQESGLDQLQWSRMESYDEDEEENSRKRRATHSTTSGGKNGKRSLADNKMATECEDKECDELEIDAKTRLAKKHELDDRKLIADDSTGADEPTLLDSHEQDNSTHEVFEQSTSAPVKVTKSRKGKMKLKPKADIQEEEEEELQAQPQKFDTSVLAAHFGGHTSNYVFGRHKQYLGNGHLYHPGGVFKDWEPSPWVRDLSMDKHFHLKDNGTLTVTKPGLYFVYAQIYYSNTHSLSSFQMFKNSEPLLQCTIEMHSKTGQTRNTCFAAGLVYLNAHDQLLLKEVEGERITIFEKTKSFFGLFRVNQS